MMVMSTARTAPFDQCAATKRPSCLQTCSARSFRVRGGCSSGKHGRQESQRRRCRCGRLDCCGSQPWSAHTQAQGTGQPARRLQCRTLWHNQLTRIKGVMPSSLSAELPTKRAFSEYSAASLLPALCTMLMGE